MTFVEKAKLRELYAAAPEEIELTYIGQGDFVASHASSDFYDAARTAIPALLDEVERCKAHETHLNEDYLTMKNVLRAEIEASQGLRGEVDQLKAANERLRDEISRLVSANAYGIAKYWREEHDNLQAKLMQVTAKLNDEMSAVMERDVLKAKLVAMTEAKNEACLIAGKYLFDSREGKHEARHAIRDPARITALLAIGKVSP